MSHPRLMAIALASAVSCWAELASGATLPGSGPRPSRAPTFAVDLPAMAAQLSAVDDASASRTQSTISLPLPDGTMARFLAAREPLFGAEFQLAHPELRAYRAVGLDDPSLRARFDLTPLGLRAMIFTRSGVALVDPLERGITERVKSYWLQDDESAAASFDCAFADVGTRSAARRWESGVRVQAAGDQLRTFRFVLVATGEYTQSLSGHAQALAQMTTAMNRIDAIFESEVSVHLEVVQLLAFDDPATDPYTELDAAGLLLRNATVVDSIYGAGNYDMTQAIGTGGSYSGRSYRAPFCFDGYRGESAVIGPDPTSNQFVIKVMPHEIGHTLGTTHTNDGGINRAPETAFEPALGWSIMTSPGDPLSFADAYFHVASLDQMDTTLTAPAGACGAWTPTGNTPPTVNAGPDFTIPTGTPFVLSGGASDPDAGDALTYAWDEVDRAPTSGDLAAGPLFRWRPPTVSPSRFMPALATVLSGVPDPLEKLPTVPRVMKFRLVARDQHPGAGGHSWDEMSVTASGSPFAVTYPNGGELLTSGLPFTVTWNVGGGSVVSSVNILLTSDGGATWQPLASGVPNDGFQDVTASLNGSSSACRIKVEAVGNIFYDLSNANFSIQSLATATDLEVFAGESVAGGVLVRWRFSDPARYASVRLERSDSADGPWGAVSGVASERDGFAQILDDEAAAKREIFYRLRATDTAGQGFTFGPVSVMTAEVPREFSILAVTPNPSRGAFTVVVGLPGAGHLRVTVLDVQGRRVATLVDGARGAGPGRYTWSGPDSQSRGSGVYFARAEFRGRSLMTRVVIAR